MVNENVKIKREDSFPYLDMELYWREDQLKFRVHLKPNQQLKYLNKGSTHTNATFKSIPSGVIKRLSKLTSATPENENLPMNEIYPTHAAAMEKAELRSPTGYPTLKECILQNTSSVNNESTEELSDDDIKKARDKARTTWFCIGYSKIWGMPISARLKRLRNKYGLTWLRNSMSYHKFTNLGQKFNSDLQRKAMKGISDLENCDRTCNCNKRSVMEDGRCQYDGNCRKGTVVYELKCLITGKSYIGKTQRYLKIRTKEHVGDIWRVISYYKPDVLVVYKLYTLFLLEL